MKRSKAEIELSKRIMEIIDKHLAEMPAVERARRLRSIDRFYARQRLRDRQKYCR